MLFSFEQLPHWFSGGTQSLQWHCWGGRKGVVSPVSQMHSFVTLKIEKQVLEGHRESDLCFFSPLMLCSQVEERIQGDM